MFATDLQLLCRIAGCVLLFFLTLSGQANSGELQPPGQGESLRLQVLATLGVPEQRAPLSPESRGQLERDGVVVEKWVFNSEPGSRIPCLLMRPKSPGGKMPAIVLTYGHGGSKSYWSYQYAAQLYARCGVACLAMDPVGEEERHYKLDRGTREHDHSDVDTRTHAVGRPVAGKMVFDAMRGIDFLESRDDIDSARIGVAGNSLGGTIAQFTAAADRRPRLAIVCGWTYDPIAAQIGKPCSRTPSRQLLEYCTFGQLAALSAPDSALLVMNGAADTIIDQRPPNGDKSGGQAWSGNRESIEYAKKVYAKRGGDPDWISDWYAKGGGHREYFATKDALEWIHRHLGTPAMTLDEIRELPTVNSGQWCDSHGLKFERLYGTALHQRGLTMPDLQLRPFSPDELAVLSTDERGKPEFTLRGWLDYVERHRD